MHDLTPGDRRKQLYQELAEDTDADGNYGRKDVTISFGIGCPTPIFVLFIPGQDREQMLPKFAPSQRWAEVAN